MSDIVLQVGCVYGQYSSLEGFAYENIRYVGMTGTSKSDISAERIVQTRLSVHLRETLDVTCNPAKVAWYQAVHSAGGSILVCILAEEHAISRKRLGDMEHDWIEKLGGPARPDGTVVQLFNLTHGRDGGWWTQRDEEWLLATSQRMKLRYATEESRREQSDRMLGVYEKRPELREQLSELQHEIQNRPERLEQNRLHGLALWQRPDYRAKQAVNRACEFCGRICRSHRSYGTHLRYCIHNPDHVTKVACVFGCGRLIFPSTMTRHARACRNNPEAERQPYGPRLRVQCLVCGQECGVGAGLTAHMKWNHVRPHAEAPSTGSNED